MMDLKNSVPVHSARKFTWDDLHGTCDASDFGDAPIHGRVRNDACDVGFIVVSPRTGRKVLFTLVEDITVEGELTATVYASVDWRQPLSVTIFND